MSIRSDRRPAVTSTLVWRLGALTMCVVPIVVACARALFRGWGPVGDNGILVVRAHDVFTRHNPLLGSWTSASVVTGQPVNNPGPLYFDLVALPVKVLGHSVGLATGVALVNIGAAVIAVIAAELIAGRTTMLAMAASVTTLEWSMGSELLFDIWQPHALLLPALAFFASAWGVACGRIWFLPLALGLASLLVQTHLSYVYLAPFTLLGALAIATLWRNDRDPSRSPGWRRPLVWSGVVVGLIWSQPIVQQLTGTEGGNLTGLIEASSQDSERVGARLGARLMAEVLAAPPFIARPSFNDTIPILPGRLVRDTVPLLGIRTALASLAVLVAVLAGVVIWRRRQRCAEHAALGTLALVLLAGCALSLTLMPVGIGGLVSHQLRWLWPVGAVVLVVVLSSVADALKPFMSRRVGDAVVLTAGLIVAAVTLPTYVSPHGPTTGRDSLVTARKLDDQIDVLEDRGTVLIDVSTLLFAEPYSGYLFSELARRDIPFVFEDESMIRQFGEGRRNRGDATSRIWLRQGAAAIEGEAGRPGVQRIALARALDTAETGELEGLEQALRADASENGLRLNDEGQRAAEEGRLPASALDPDPGQHPFESIGDLNLAVREGWLDLTPDQATRYQRLVALRTRQAFDTVAIFAAPIDVRPSD